MECHNVFFPGDDLKLLNRYFARSLRIPLRRDAIREMLLERTIKKKKKLKNELSGALVSIKFDGLTRLRSHFLGISAQYFNTDYGLTTKTLTLIDTEANHTGSNLKNSLLSILREYEINIKQILACVVDGSRTNTHRTNTHRTYTPGQIPTGQLPPLQNTPWTYTHHKMKCEEK